MKSKRFVKCFEMLNFYLRVPDPPQPPDDGGDEDPHPPPPPPPSQMSHFPNR